MLILVEQDNEQIFKGEADDFLYEHNNDEELEMILSEFEEEPEKIWTSNLFGKPLNELMGEGLQSKLGRIPDEERVKIQETLQRVINDGGNGLVCIIL